jgi:hypothetical protein
MLFQLLQSELSRSKQQYYEKIANLKKTHKRELRTLAKTLRQTETESERQIKALEQLNQLNAQLETRVKYEQEQLKQLSSDNDINFAQLQEQIGKLENEKTGG